MPLHLQPHLMLQVLLLQPWRSCHQMSEP
uniref:Uncharacterized protein n=1 Tax=Arundo donax TaxID=35708 RepID=A0A0A9B870_ARUDO